MKRCMNSSRITRPLQLAALIAAGAIAGTAAHEANARVTEVDGRLTTTIRYSDLDLSTPHGRAALKRRIEKAADSVCGSADARDLRISIQYRTCMADATNAALSQVNLPNG